MPTILLLMLLLTAASCTDVTQDADEDYESQSDNFDGRSFFFLGTLFRRWRNRWMALHDAAPLYAGAAFPINGYFNCPSFGCNPAAIGPQPGGYYPAYYAAPFQPQQQQQQQQQHAQGNSNVYIYSSDQQHGIPPYGPAFFGPTRQPMPLSPPPPLPLPLPPPTLLPPSLQASPQAGASSFGFGSGPVPLPGCGTNPMACALG